MAPECLSGNEGHPVNRIHELLLYNWERIQEANGMGWGGRTDTPLTRDLGHNVVRGGYALAAGDSEV